MGNILEINNLVKRYIGFKLGEISLSLESGAILGIVGPNGAGKTTLIKSILGMVVKDAGTINVFNKSIDKGGVEIRDRIGFVSNEISVKDLVTPKLLGKIYGNFYSKWNQKLYDDYLFRFELPPSKRLNKLSQGMQMKTSLAFALSHDADLLILDEPTAGLDPIFREEIIDILLQELEDTSKSIIISSHITSDLDKCADYLLVMNKGKTLLSGAKDEIIESHRLIRADKADLNQISKESFVNIRKNKFGFEGLTNKIEAVTENISKEYVIEKPRVEDIMYYYCKKYVEMKHIILKYFRRRATLLYSFLLIPAIFITIGNMNLVFLTYVSFTFSFVFIFDDFSYAVALPISRKNIVIANYLAYTILALLNLTYITSILFLGNRFLGFSTGQSLSIIGILYSINILGFFSLYIPISIISKDNPIVARYSFFIIPLGYLLISPILHYFEVLANINVVYHILFTLLLVTSLSGYGIKISLKKIEVLDF